MKTANYSEFESNLKKYLSSVESENETLIVKNSTGNDGAVILSINEYNSIMETIHLLSSKANRDRLFESIKQMKNGESSERELIQP